MRVIRRSASRLRGVPVSTLAGIGLAIWAAAPADAAECVTSRGMIEAVRLCDPAERSAVDSPRAVSVVMPRGVTPSSHRSLPRRQAAAQASAHASIITDVASRYRIDPGLLSAMIHVESAGRTRAVSSKGALGLMQVMPATARSMGVANPDALLADPALAIETGAAYLKTLQAQLGNNVPLIVAAYNAGPGAVLKAGRRVPAYQETQRYVGRVMANYASSRADALR